MISERSCDTEDWSNDDEYSALHHRNKAHFKIDSDKSNQLNYIFYQINAALMRIKYIFQKITNLNYYKLLATSVCYKQHPMLFNVS